MIKKLLFASLLCSLCLNLSGQSRKNFKPEWNIGIGAGPTFSSVDFQAGTINSEGVSTSTKQQLSGGISGRYISEKNLGIIVELNYSQQGWDEQFPSDDLNYEGATYSRQLNYLEMPILTHIYFGRKVRFFINLGPKISYLISEKEEINDVLANYISSGNLPARKATDQYYKKIENKFDYGIMGGMGVEFRSGIGNFALEGRYYFGLSDIYSNSKSAYFGRSANQVISARLTYYTKLF